MLFSSSCQPLVYLTATFWGGLETQNQRYQCSEHPHFDWGYGRQLWGNSTIVIIISLLILITLLLLKLFPARMSHSCTRTLVLTFLFCLLLFRGLKKIPRQYTFLSGYRRQYNQTFLNFVIYFLCLIYSDSMYEYNHTYSTPLNINTD